MPDYSSVGTEDYATAYNATTLASNTTISNAPAAGYNQYVLVSAGFPVIGGSGYYVIKGDKDILGSDPSVGPNYQYYYASDQSGTSKDPYQTNVYSATATGSLIQQLCFDEMGSF
jgi:hypothetical protein